MLKHDSFFVLPVKHRRCIQNDRIQAKKERRPPGENRWKKLRKELLDPLAVKRRSPSQFLPSAFAGNVIFLMISLLNVRYNTVNLNISTFLCIKKHTKIMTTRNRATPLRSQWNPIYYMAPLTTGLRRLFASGPSQTGKIIGGYLQAVTLKSSCIVLFLPIR